LLKVIETRILHNLKGGALTAKHLPCLIKEMHDPEQTQRTRVW
jgi:hypothetical protein